MESEVSSTDPSPPEAPGPDLRPSPDSKRARRRRLRRFLILGGFLVIVSAVGFALRATLVAALCAWILPGELASRLGGQVNVDRVEALIDVDGWHLNFGRIEHRGENAPAIPHSMGQQITLSVRDLTLHFPSLWSLRNGLAAFTSIEASEINYDHHPADPDGPLVPSLYLPPEIPELPRHLEIRQLSIRNQSQSLKGNLSVRDHAVTAEFRASDIGELQAISCRLERKSATELAMTGRFDPYSHLITGQLVRKDSAWRGNWGPVQLQIPTQERAEVLAQVEGFEVQRLARILEDHIPSFGKRAEGQADVTLRIRNHTLTADAVLRTDEGAFDVAGQLDEQQLIVRTQSKNFQIGTWIQPLLSSQTRIEAVTEGTATLTIPLTGADATAVDVVALITAREGRLVSREREFPLRDLRLHCNWRPNTGDDTPLQAELDLQLDPGQLSVRGSGTRDWFRGEVKIEHCDLAIAQDWLPQDWALSGACSADLELLGPISELTWSGNFACPRGTVTWQEDPLEFQAVQARGFYRKGTWVLHEWSASSQTVPGQLEGQLRVNEGALEHFQGKLGNASGTVEFQFPDEEPESMKAEFAGFDPGPAFDWVFRDRSLTLPLHGTLEATWAGEATTYKGTLRADRGRYQDGTRTFDLRDLDLSGHWSPGNLHLERLSVRSEDGTLQCDASVLPAVDDPRFHIIDAKLELESGLIRASGQVSPEQLDVEVVLDAFDLGAIASSWSELQGLEATTTAQLEIVGSPDDPRVTGLVELPRASLPFRGQPVVATNIVVQGSYDKSGLRVERASAEALAGEIEADGLLAITPEQSWKARVRYRDIDLNVLEPWAPFLRSLDGTISGQARMAGSRDAPRVTAAGSLRDGELAFTGWERFRSVTALFTYSDRVVEFLDVKTKTSGGELSGRSTLKLAEDGSLEQLRTRLDFQEVLLFRSSDLMVRGSGRATLTSTPEESVLAGDLRITRGIYNRNYYPRISTGNTIPFDLFSFEDDFLSNLRFDLGFDLDGEFAIRNNRVRTAPTGKLRLLGTGAVPYLVGSVATTEGSLLLPNLSLNISYAELQFPTDDPFRPLLTLQGSGQSRRHEITLSVTGPMAEPEITFRSDPELPEEELLLLVATGRLPTDLAGERVEQVAALELARVYAPEVWEWLFGRSEGGVLESVEITTESAQDAGDEDRIAVEVGISKNMSVQAERDHRGDFNVDLKLFWWLP